PRGVQRQRDGAGRRERPVVAHPAQVVGGAAATARGAGEGVGTGVAVTGTDTFPVVDALTLARGGQEAGQDGVHVHRGADVDRLDVGLQLVPGSVHVD